MKKILVLLLFFISSAFAQKADEQTAPINWQLMDWKQDGYPGISLEKAYSELLKNKKPLKRIVLAIIDGDGVDSTHPDLLNVNWINKKEIAANNVDDDNNGYIDDIHGWNFGGNSNYDTRECVREYVRLRSTYENRYDTTGLYKDANFPYWKKVLAQKNRLFEQSDFYSNIIACLKFMRIYLTDHLKTDSVRLGNIRTLQLSEDKSPELSAARDACLNIMDKGDFSDSLTVLSVENGFSAYVVQVRSSTTLNLARTVINSNDPAYFRREQVGDDPYTNTIRNYGNNNVSATPGWTHATAVAGIISALRNNGLGGNGITNAVDIISIKIDAHEGDEWDKDVANAIRYATDNGAQIINMSFGKYLSPQKEWVDEAMKYAERKNVLLIASAGNDASNNDAYPNYPASVGKDIISNLIKVGASTYDSSLVVGYSNYGPQSVDVFAPGNAAYTTVPNGEYQTVQGTSFATPVVAGLAALIWSYYPGLTCRQIKSCIERSAVAIPIVVTKPGTKEKVPFSSLSKTGGIVNAYRALSIADQYKKGKQTKP